MLRPYVMFVSPGTETHPFVGEGYGVDFPPHPASPLRGEGSLGWGSRKGAKEQATPASHLLFSALDLLSIYSFHAMMASCIITNMDRSA